MREQRTAGGGGRGAPWPRLSIWDILVADDDTELDPEELAAFVEGRLPPGQHEETRRLVARSPRAMEVVDSLHSLLGSDAASGTRPAPAQPRGPASRKHAADDWRSLALAASILVAALAGFAAVYFHRQAGSLGRRIALAELVSYKERLCERNRTPPWMLGQTSPALLELALERPDWPADAPVPPAPVMDPGDDTRGAGPAESDPLVLRDGESGEPPEPAPDQPALDQVLRTTRAWLDRPQADVESVSLLLAAGHLDQALREAEAAGDRAGEPTPELLNLQAAAWFQSASSRSSAEASEADYDRAESLLRQAIRAAPTDASSWFNLALLRRARGQASREREAWDQYLQCEQRPEYAARVRALLER